MPVESRFAVKMRDDEFQRREMREMKDVHFLALSFKQKIFGRIGRSSRPQFGSNGLNTWGFGLANGGMGATTCCNIFWTLYLGFRQNISNSNNYRIWSPDTWGHVIIQFRILQFIWNHLFCIYSFLSEHQRAFNKIKCNKPVLNAMFLPIHLWVTKPGVLLEQKNEHQCRTVHCFGWLFGRTVWCCIWQLQFTTFNIPYFTLSGWLAKFEEQSILHAVNVGLSLSKTKEKLNLREFCHLNDGGFCALGYTESLVEQVQAMISTIWLNSWCDWDTFKIFYA